MKGFYFHNLMLSPMVTVCGHLRHLPLNIKHVECVLLPLGPQNATGPPRASAEIAESLRKASNVNLQTSALYPPQSPQPILPSHLSGDHTYHLEQLLDYSLATVAAIQISGSTMADVLTPRAYDTIKALYALAALDAAASKPRGSEIPFRSTSSEKADECPYSSNRSPPLPNSSFAVPRTVRMHGHVSISVDYVVLISWAGLVAVFCVLVFFWERIFVK